MKARVASCCSGSTFYYRVEARVNGRHTRFRVGWGEADWTRGVATEALDILVGMGCNRKSVKFIHN